MVSSVFRVCGLEHAANQEKLVELSKILPEFQASIKTVQAWQYEAWLDGGNFWNRRCPKHLPTNLSQRFMRSVVNQTVAGLKSWEALMQIKFREIVADSTLSDMVQLDLWRINARKAWYQKTLILPELRREGDKYVPTGRDVVIPQWLLKLARRIVKQVKKRYVSIPNLSKTRTLQLDGPVAKFEKAEYGLFDYWLTASTLNKGNPVRIPLFSNDHVEAQSGDWAALTQITFQHDGNIIFRQVRKTEPAAKQTIPKDGSESLGLDFGLRSLYATSQGTIHGHKLYQWLKERDAELTVLTRSLQRQNIKLSTNKRYKRFQKRIRDYVTNETNRVLNRIMQVHSPAELVVEKLDFRGGGLSRVLSRILSRAGRKTVKQKLASLQETTGTTITTVPAPYTSQTCSGCGWVDPASRKGTQFHCVACGFKLHADINAARNIKARRSWPSWMQYAGKKKTLTYLHSKYAERNPRPHRRANHPSSPTGTGCKLATV